jgi:hypothetical protein
VAAAFNGIAILCTLHSSHKPSLLCTVVMLFLFISRGWL